MKRRVVITGLGIVSPVGNDIPTAWDNIVNGRSGIGRITRFDPSALTAQIAGEVKDFDLTPYISSKEAKQMDSFIHYGVAAGTQAGVQATLMFMTLYVIDQFGFFAILLLMLVIRTLFSKVAAHLGWQHQSPSMVIAGAVQMSDYFPGLEKTWELKDRSSQSFPGDHASVLIIWALFMGLFSRTLGQRLVIWGLAVVFMLPRLVAGAHWGQDDYIGGLLLAVWALGWGYYTPFAAKASELLMRLTAPLFKLLGALPVISRMSVVRSA